MAVCRMCGAKLNEGAVFCEKCGTKVIVSEDAAPKNSSGASSDKQKTNGSNNVIPESNAQTFSKSNGFHETASKPLRKKLGIIVAVAAIAVMVVAAAGACLLYLLHDDNGGALPLSTNDSAITTGNVTEEPNGDKGENNNTNGNTVEDEDDPTEVPLTASELKPIIHNLAERRIFVINGLFGVGVSRSQNLELVNVTLDGVEGVAITWKGEVTDPAYRTVDDVRGAVTTIFTASLADSMFEMVKDADGGPEYRFTLRSGSADGPRHLFSMYKEENGKLYYYAVPTELLISGRREYGDITILSQTSEKISVLMDMYVTGWDWDLSEETKIPTIAEVTIMKENGEWRLNSYAEKPVEQS